MSRPYQSWSIDQLEAEFERVQDAGDAKGLEHLVGELRLRTTSRARNLKAAIEKFRDSPGEQPTDEADRRSAATRSTTGVDRKSTTVVLQGGGNRAGGALNDTRAQNRNRLRLKPTEEQAQAIEQFQAGGSLKINAYAGTGKTSTLELLAHNTMRSGQYIAFNKDIVRDAREKFPATVNCSTTHGLAFKATPSGYKNNSQKMTGRMSANQLADLLKLKRWQVGAYTLKPRSQGYLILETLRRFMQSADRDLRAEHVPRHGSLVAASEPTLKAVAEFALHGARYVWDRMRDENDPVPLGHDGYLKLWALSEPIIAADYILLDEAQDTNPVVLEVLRRQSAQMIYVGDKYQQIYEWRGAVNAMEKLQTDATSYLTTSFRFGPAIADAASKVLALLGEHRPIRGNPKVNSRIGPVVPRTILARTNASAMAAVIESLDANRKPHLVGGTDEIMEMLKGVQDLKEGRQSTVPDFFGFDRWEDIVEFAKSGEGDHLLTFVKLVESRGERQLMWALNHTVDEEMSDVVVSTAHKAKGREWNEVRLMDDFLRSKPRRAMTDEKSGQNGHDFAELRLFYVALTRAKLGIDVPETVLSLIR